MTVLHTNEYYSELYSRFENECLDFKDESFDSVKRTQVKGNDQMKQKLPSFLFLLSKSYSTTRTWVMIR